MIWSPTELSSEWRRVIGEEVWRSIQRTWLPEYDREARDALDQTLSRVMTAMTRNGETSMADSGRDGLISLTHLDPATLRDRGDRRYGSANLANFLSKNPKLDLVPMVCAVIGPGKIWVQDGHHRMRAYRSVGRKALTFLSVTVPGSGLIRLALPRPETPAGSGTESL
jgi:hypothetical protein